MESGPRRAPGSQVARARVGLVRGRKTTGVQPRLTRASSQEMGPPKDGAPKNGTPNLFSKIETPKKLAWLQLFREIPLILFRRWQTWDLKVW